MGKGSWRGIRREARVFWSGEIEEHGKERRRRPLATSARTKQRGRSVKAGRRRIYHMGIPRGTEKNAWGGWEAMDWPRTLLFGRGDNC